MSSSEEFEIYYKPLDLSNSIESTFNIFDRFLVKSLLEQEVEDIWIQQKGELVGFSWSLSVESQIDRLDEIRRGEWRVICKRPKQPSPDLFRNEPEDRAFLAKKWIRDKEKGFIFQIYGFQPDQEHWIKLEYDHYTSEIGLNEKREFINLATDETHPCDRSAMQVEWLK